MIITLPTKKTEKLEDLARLWILLYGPPKFGKSTFAAGAPNAVFLPTEAGQNSLEIFKIPEEPGKTIESWEEMLQAQELLFTQKHPFKTIVIDTIDQAYSLVSKYMLGKYGKEHESDLGFGKGFTIVTNELYRFINRFVAHGYGGIMISHSTERQVEINGADVQRTVPTLMSNARRAVLGMVDAILYVDNFIGKNADGTPKITRVIRTKPTGSYEAGDRMQPPLPPIIEFNYEKFAQAYKNRKPIEKPVVGVEDKNATAKKKDEPKPEPKAAEKAAVPAVNKPVAGPAIPVQTQPVLAIVPPSPAAPAVPAAASVEKKAEPAVPVAILTPVTPPAPTQADPTPSGTAAAITTFKMPTFQHLMAAPPAPVTKPPAPIMPTLPAPAKKPELKGVSPINKPPAAQPSTPKAEEQLQSQSVIDELKKEMQKAFDSIKAPGQ